MILDGYLVAKNLDAYILNEINKNKDYYIWKYVAFLLFNNNEPSRVYIKMKQNKAHKFWLQTKIIEKVNADFETASNIVNKLNLDENCIWILIQLPVNDKIKPYQHKLLSQIHLKKDIDGLWGVLFGLNQIDAIRFLPATARAVFEILSFYKIWVAGKNISILWQSNLAGKPIVLEMIRQNGTVFSFNEFSDQNLIKELTRKSDIIISATWKLHLINSSYLNPNRMQVLIDIGWWKLDNKPTWDYNFEEIFSAYDESNFMYTPVPGWVGPVTVSSIFANLVDLKNIEK